MIIGFIGLGVMGAPMAAHFVTDSQMQVRLYDVDPQRSVELAAAGGTAVDSIAEAVASADVIFTSLPGPKQIESVAYAENGLFESMSIGSTWIDLSTNNLTLCKRLNESAAKRGINFIDAPVSGGDEGARAASLTVLVGATDELFERFLPKLKIIGSDVRHVGTSGAGYSAKIAQVVLCYLHSLALSEALMLGVKGGVEVAQMLSIIQNSTGHSYVSDRYGPPILNGDYDPSFSLGLAHKDMKLAQQMAENLGLELPLCDLTTATYERALEQFGYDANHLKAVRLLEQNNDTYLQQ